MKILLTAALLTVAAYAGPPMICHQVHIGNEKSLPWGSSGANWNDPSPSYDKSDLVKDTLALLNRDTPVLARMETLRRAAIYTESTNLAKQLADSLVARAEATNADPLASFDAGYFIEAVHQLAAVNKRDPLAGTDGYTIALKSLGSAKDTAAVEYGLSLIRSSRPPWPNEHFLKAKAGAKPGTLLAENVAQFETR